jgi:hypothetical protein
METALCLKLKPSTVRRLPEIRVIGAIETALCLKTQTIDDMEIALARESSHRDRTLRENQTIDDMKTAPARSPILRVAWGWSLPETQATDNTKTALCVRTKPQTTWRLRFA